MRSYFLCLRHKLTTPQLLEYKNDEQNPEYTLYIYHTTSVTLKHYFQQKMHKTQRNIFFVVDHVYHLEILTSCIFFLTHPQYLFEFGSKYV